MLSSTCVRLQKLKRRWINNGVCLRWSIMMWSHFLHETFLCRLSDFDHEISGLGSWYCITLIIVIIDQSGKTFTNLFIALQTTNGATYIDSCFAEKFKLVLRIRGSERGNAYMKSSCSMHIFFSVWIWLSTCVSSSSSCGISSQKASNYDGNLDFRHCSLNKSGWCS